MNMLYRGIRLLLRRADSPPAQPHRILVVAVGFLGDLVVLGPFLRALRMLYPSAAINLLIERTGACLVNGSPYIDNLILFDKNRRFDPWYLVRFIISMRMRRFDLAFVHYAHFQFEWILFLLGIRYCYGYDKDVGFTHDASYRLLSRRIPKSLYRNEIDNSFAFFDALGHPMTPEREGLCIRINEESHRRAVRLLQEAGGAAKTRIIGFHIGATAINKQWPPSRWAELGEFVIRNRLGHIVITGGGESERDEGEIVHRLGGGVIPLCGKLSLEDLVALISRYSMMVTTDSGPKHFAYALRVPTVDLYGLSHSWQWGSYWDKELHSAMEKKPLTSFDPALVEDPRYNDIIQQVTAAEVAAAMMRLLGVEKACMP